MLAHGLRRANRPRVCNPQGAALVRSKSAKTLAEALAGMRFEVLPWEFSLVGFEGPLDERDLGLLQNEPVQLIREGGETTLLLRAELADAVLARHPSASVQRDLAWIRFAMTMEWELVGFLACVSAALAEAGVPIGAVCGYSRDGIFVARPHLERTRDVLARLFPPS